MKKRAATSSSKGKASSSARSKPNLRPPGVHDALLPLISTKPFGLRVRQKIEQDGYCVLPNIFTQVQSNLLSYLLPITLASCLFAAIFS